MKLITQYLTTGELPSDPREARSIRLKSVQYSMVEGQLYRRSTMGPMLRCIGPTEAQRLMEEIHEGVCGNHSGGRSLAHKALTARYFWPYMMTEAARFAKRCDKCQRFAPLKHRPAEELHSNITPWPFAKWGLDIVGELPRSLGGKMYVLLATDYFTKWVEAEAYTTVNKADTINFIWKNIICRYGIPREIHADHGTQFQNAKLKELCDLYDIKLSFSSVSYPQGNGQAESTNKAIFGNIKKNLQEAKGKWLEELPAVVWAHRTTERKSTWRTPFAMVYGSETVIPTEIGLPTLCSKRVENAPLNEQQLGHNTDLLEETRDVALIHLASYQ